ncbi:MAG: hypothetical protein L0226_18195 [Acidobacteria bacterium]|nr:hypothetical protein [Acidobacteriota bacterium]
MSLREAVARGLIEVFGDDFDIESVRINILSKASMPLEITIDAGTVFEKAPSGKMIIKEMRIVTLPVHGNRQSINVNAADMGLCRCSDVDESDKLTVSQSSPPAEIRKLLELPEFREEDARLQQFAIWTITDNPTRNGYCKIDEGGIVTSIELEGIERIRYIFEQAGISTKKYRALRKG